MFSYVKDRTKNFYFNAEMINYLNTRCNVTNLIKYLKINVQRAYFQCFIVAFLILSFSLLVLDINSESTYDELRDIVVRFTIVVVLFLFAMCTVFCFFYVLYVANKLHLFLPDLKSSVESYKKFENNINNSIKKWHVSGVLTYFFTSSIVAFIFVNLFNMDCKIENYLSDFIIYFGTFAGAIWNYTDFFADKTVDWNYIIKGRIPIFEDNKITDPKEIEVLIELRTQKFNYFKKHSILLGKILLFTIIYVCAIFALGNRFFGVELDFFSNTYIVFFTTVCVLFYKSCYASYYKDETPNKKIYPHISDFKGFK